MKKLIKQLLVICMCILFFMGCTKDRYIFTMKSIKLNSYKKNQLITQNIFLKIITTDGSNTVLATTESYPSSLTLPAIFAINPRLHLHLYKDPIIIQLWGTSTGFIASSTLNMKEYKIIYPIDMETENEEVSFSVMGSWE